MNNVLTFNRPAISTVPSTVVLEGEYLPVGEEKQSFMSHAFQIDERPIFSTDENGMPIQIKNRKGLFVGNKNVNIVAPSYKIVQPADVIRTFENTSGLTIDRVLTNHNTGAILLKSSLENPFIDGEEHKIDLTFYTGHNGQYRTLLSLQALRVACFNQMPAIAGNKNLWLMSEKHYSSFNLEHMQSIIEQLPLMIANFKNQYVALKDINLSKKDFLELFATHYKATDKAIEKMSDVYSFARGQESLSDNGYKAYQAITYDLTHNGRNGKNGLEKDNIKSMTEAHKFMQLLQSVA